MCDEKNTYINIQGNVIGSSINAGDDVNQVSNTDNPVQKTPIPLTDIAELPEQDLLQKSLLLSRLARKEHFKQFDKAFAQYRDSEHRRDETTKSRIRYYQKPLVLILHGDESAQLDQILKRIQLYEIRRILNNKDMNAFCDVPENIEIQHYPIPLCHFFHDTHCLTEELSHFVLGNAACSIEEVTKRFARLNLPILIELNICAEHLKDISAKQREHALLAFINYWATLEKVKQKKPLIIILSFKYQPNRFLIPSSFNKSLRNTLTHFQDNDHLNNVEVLPEFDKLTQLEVVEWIKCYFSACRNNPIGDTIDSFFSAYKSLTMKQAIIQFEQLLQEHW